MAEGARTRLFVGTYAIDCACVDGHWRIARSRFDLEFIDVNRRPKQSAADQEQD